jgi:predicted DNA binding CopG/RHH family protein
MNREAAFPGPSAVAWQRLFRTASVDAVNRFREGIAMAEPVRKSKQIAIRLSLEEWQAVRQAAYSRGLEMGPMVAEWIRPHIERLKGTPREVPDD